MFCHLISMPNIQNLSTQAWDFVFVVIIIYQIVPFVSWLKPCHVQHLFYLNIDWQTSTFPWMCDCHTVTRKGLNVKIRLVLFKLRWVKIYCITKRKWVLNRDRNILLSTLTILVLRCLGLLWIVQIEWILHSDSNTWHANRRRK